MHAEERNSSMNVMFAVELESHKENVIVSVMNLIVIINAVVV